MARLETNTEPFNVETKTFIKDLFTGQFSYHWLKEKRRKPGKCERKPRKVALRPCCPLRPPVEAKSSQLNSLRLRLQTRGCNLAIETSQLKSRVLEPPRSPGPASENKMEKTLQLENRLPNTEGAPENSVSTSLHDEENPEILPSCDLHMDSRFGGIPATLGPIQKRPRLVESDDERIYEGSLYPLKQLLNARAF